MNNIMIEKQITNIDPIQKHDLISLKNLVPVADMINISLVLSDSKPVTDVSVSDSLKAKEVIDKLSTIGLKSAMVEKEDGRVLISVSKDLKLAEEASALLPLIGAEKGKKHTEHDKRYGELMGFPNSAIQAFMSGETLTIQQEDQIFKDFGLEDNFLYFRLSRDNFKEELRALASWFKIILDNNPELIDCLFTDHERVERLKQGMHRLIASFL